MAYKVKSSIGGYKIKKPEKKKSCYEIDIGGQKVRAKSKYELQKKLNKMQKEETIIWGYKEF